MYDAELSFLNEHIDLIEAGQFEKLQKLVGELHNNDGRAFNPDVFGNNIMSIFYDSDVHIDPFANLESIPSGYCFSCKCLPESLILPKTVKDIGVLAFSNSNVSDIVLPEGLIFIDFDAFSACENLETIIIPNSVSTISNDAFKDCYNLEVALLPTGLDFLGAKAFEGTQISGLSVNTADITQIWPKKVKVYTNEYDDGEVFAGLTGEYAGKFKDFRRA